MVFSKGFGLLDLMITIMIFAILTSLAIPAYDVYVKRAKVARAIGDISGISLTIERFRLQFNDRVPDSLAELNVEIPLDPWGREYEFLNIQSGGPGVGSLRKDGKLNPLNSDFDLYSRGKDGESRGPLSAKASHDDIVRANNGSYVGLGEDY